MDFFFPLTESIIKMVILKNAYPFHSNIKTNCWLGTINIFFSCDSCFFKCDFFCIGQTEKLKQRTWKHKPDVNHAINRNCKNCSEHFRTCSKMKENFQFLPIFLWRKKVMLHNELGATVEFLSISPFYTLT